MSRKERPPSASNAVKANRISLLARRAGRLAEKNRKKGYH